MQGISNLPRPLPGLSVAPSAAASGLRARAVLIGTSLVILTLLSRLPFVGRYLFDWDSLQFALGMQRFDLASHRPHPPGYIGYVMAGRLLAPLAGGADAALVGLSIAGEAGAVAGIYLVGRKLFGEFAGICAAIVLLTSPLFWLYGETALTYGIEPGLSLLGFWMICRARPDGDGAALPAAALVIGLIGAFRPSTEVFLLPLLAYALVRGGVRHDRRRLVATGSALALGTVAWLLPLLLLSGGPAAYAHASLQLGARVSGGTALWRAGPEALWSNALAVIAGLSYALVLLVPLGLAAAITAWFQPARAAAVRHRPLLAMIAVWVAPALLTYLLVHIGQLAYVLFAVPAAALLAGPALTLLARSLAGWSRLSAARVRVGLLACCVLANLALFAAPGNSILSRVANRDDHVAALLATVDAYPAAATVLITDPEGPASYRTAQYYLPEYQAVAVGAGNNHKVGELFATHGGAPEYELDRFQTPGPLRISTGTIALVLDQQVLSVIGDVYRLRPIRLGSLEDHIYQAQLDPADPPTICRNWIVIHASDCVARSEPPYPFRRALP